jgi:2-oxoisovalerate dehydrogenase E1 component
MSSINPVAASSFENRPPKDYWEQALFIRRVEEKLFALYGQGKLHGTMHACIGQEFSALAFCGQLESGDVVFSNHRCHGHYLAFTGDAAGLIAELMGKRSGTCAGAGGSQHLCRDGFFSNGVQGGIVPVAAGLAWSLQMRGDPGVGVAFIGDGTLGQGVVYETANIAAKQSIPLLLVVEDNGWAQSTPRESTLAGDIRTRFDTFGIRSFHGSTSQPEALWESAAEAIAYVRLQRRPAVHWVDTQRLCPHSKSDDCRAPDLVAGLAARDPLSQALERHPGRFRVAEREIKSTVDSLVAQAEALPAMTLRDFVGEPTVGEAPAWEEFQPDHAGTYVSRLNQAFHELMDSRREVIFLGEDLRSPYGGAFKATAGLSDRWPERVPAMPISEAAITGLANGFALGGSRPVVEIMFGDFLTLAMDQLVNHAAKFRHMYNHQARCPMVLRLPMGGGRGYGPTHSQTMDKLLLGVDGLRVVACNLLVDPKELYGRLMEGDEPTVVIENKNDYSRRVSLSEHPFYRHFHMERSGRGWPTIRLRPAGADVTLVTYGGCTHAVLRAAETLFREFEILAEIVIVSCLRPLPWPEIQDAVSTDRVFAVEEGSAQAGFGSEILAGLVESGRRFLSLRRIASLPLPIPAVPELERQVLVSESSIVKAVTEAFDGMC